MWVEHILNFKNINTGLKNLEQNLKDTIGICCKISICLYKVMKMYSVYLHRSQSEHASRLMTWVYLTPEEEADGGEGRGDAHL